MRYYAYASQLIGVKRCR